MENNAIVVKEAIVVIIVALRYYFELHLSCISMAGLHQRADNGRQELFCSSPWEPSAQSIIATMHNPVTGKVHFTPKVFSVMNSMHNASDECILSSWESWNDFLLHQTSYSNARSVMQNKELILKSTLWRRLFRVEQTHSVFQTIVFAHQVEITTRWKDTIRGLLCCEGQSLLVEGQQWVSCV